MAFGAAYPWAYLPLLTACAASGWLGLRAPLRRALPPPSLSLPAAIALVAGVTLLQLVPVPRSAIAVISPAADSFLERYDLLYALAADTHASASPPSDVSLLTASAHAHTLSIDPAATRLALTFVCVFGLFFLGTARCLSSRRLKELVNGVIVLGTVLAVIGMIQNANFNGKIYGFWTPIHNVGAEPFGPFVNHNHFAGWMLMALSLGLGYFCGLVARGTRGVKSGWRNRLLWCSSRAASQAILIGFSLFVMGLALVLTRSRSGIAAFAAALVAAGLVVVRRQGGAMRKMLVIVYVLLVGALSVGIAGLDIVVHRFAALPVTEYSGRIPVWQDALAVARDFWLTGSGLNTFGTVMLFYQAHSPTVHFAEAHSDYLQLAAEGGLLLGIPLVILTIVFVREAIHRFRERADDETSYWIRVGAVTGLLVIALQETVEFSLQMPGNAALFCVLAAIAVHPGLKAAETEGNTAGAD